MALNFPSAQATWRKQQKIGLAQVLALKGEVKKRREENITKTRTELQPLTLSFIPGEWPVRLRHLTVHSWVHWC